MDIVACPKCGEVLEGTELAQELHHLRVQNERMMEVNSGLQAKLEAVQGLLAGQAVKNRALTKEKEGELPNNRFYQVGVEVLEGWRELCWPGAKEIRTGERMRNVLKRLEGGYDKDTLIRAAYGYSRFPYLQDGRRVVHGTPKTRYIDAELVYRDPQHVDQGLALAEEADHRDKTLPEIEQAHTNQQLSEFGQAAVRFAMFGFHVFPCVPRGKVPATQNGFQDATRDVNRITNFWAKKPDHNVGIRAGKESGIIVLDVDCGGDDRDDGFDTLSQLEKRFGELPKTLSVVTPRGGSHFYFRHPGVEIRNTQGFPGPGLDIRGDGGYILGPPSIGQNSRAYEVDSRVSIADPPSWLLRALGENQSRLKRSIDTKEYESIVREGASPGERNGALVKLTGHLWNKVDPGMVLGIVMNTNRAFRQPLPDQEVEKIVLSVQRMRAREALKRLKES